jgi:acyl carrier protein
MTKKEFLARFIEAIELEEEISMDTKLSSIEEWDSLAAVSTLALFKKELNLNINSADIANCKTVADVINLGKEKYD